MDQFINGRIRTYFIPESSASRPPLPLIASGVLGVPGDPGTGFFFWRAASLDWRRVTLRGSHIPPQTGGGAQGGRENAAGAIRDAQDPDAHPHLVKANPPRSLLGP